MKYTISKAFTFSAAHRLTGLPADHPCARLHGHNYRFETVLEADHLSPVGFVRDYTEMAQLRAWIEETFEHRCLNDVVGFNPTAENLAEYIFCKCREAWPELVAVRVSETEGTWAEYRRA